jgi:tRNA G37 N-methylase Trm5
MLFKVEGDFLLPALKALKPEGGIIHFYQFTPEKDPFTEPIRLCREAGERVGKRVEILDTRTVGRVAPMVMRVCVDARIC